MLRFTIEYGMLEYGKLNLISTNSIHDHYSFRNSSVS